MGESREEREIGILRTRGAAAPPAARPWMSRGGPRAPLATKYSPTSTGTQSRNRIRGRPSHVRRRRIASPWAAFGFPAAAATSTPPAVQGYRAEQAMDALAHRLSPRWRRASSWSRRRPRPIVGSTAGSTRGLRPFRDLRFATTPAPHQTYCRVDPIQSQPNIRRTHFSPSVHLPKENPPQKNHTQPHHSQPENRLVAVGTA